MSGRTRVGRPVALVCAFALLATIIVVTALPSGEVQAARQAPTAPMPACVVSDQGAQGLGCVPGNLGAAVGGTFAAGGSFSVLTSPAGLSPCLTHVSTGCYYSLNTPSITRCVYLANNDPTDVRSCGTLSTQGGVSAQRQGTCSGALGGTFVYGGHAQKPWEWWIVRAAIASLCHFKVPDTRPIDNLRGPTFWLVQTSVRECIEPGGGFGCDESWATLATRTEFAWLPVTGTLAPHAAFIPNELGPGLFEFENISEPYAQGNTTWEWTFGDGATATSKSPVHQYDEPGTYSVRLTMRSSAGPSTSVTRVVEVSPPELTVSVFNPEARFGPGETGNRYNIGDEFVAKVVVSTDLGLGNLTGVAPAPELVVIPPQLEALDPLPVVEPMILGSNARLEYEIPVKAIASGLFDLDSTWNGSDSSGAAIGPVTGTLAGSVTGLMVEVTTTPDPLLVDHDNNGDGQITDADNEIAIKVKVTNVSNTDITGITYDELDLSSNLLRDPAVHLELQSAPTRAFQDLAVGASDELEWVYLATDAVDARAQIIVRGQAGGFEVATNGETDVKGITERLIEASITLDNQQLVSGKVVRISGTFKNVTDGNEHPRNVSFAVERTFEDGPSADAGASGQRNGGNGWFTSEGSETSAGLEMFELAPGQQIELDAIVHTLETPETTGFTIKYAVMPFAEKLDEDGNPVVPQVYEPADPRNVIVSDEGGSSDTHRVRLAGVTQTPEPFEWLSCAQELGFGEYLSCKLVRGVGTAARGLWEIGVLLSDGVVAVAQAKLYTDRLFIEYLLSDSAARQAIRDEIVAELTEMKRLGHEALASIDVTHIPVLVGDMIVRAIQRIENVLNTNDIKLIYGEMAEIVGENIDFALEGIVAARVAIKATMAVGGRAGLLRSSVLNQIEANSQKSIDDALRVIREQGERSLPGSRVMRAGVDVTNYPEIAKAFGASVDDVRNLFKIAEDQGVTIVFRSRSPKSIELIESGRALPKPQGVKTKGVNDLDMQYLDYPTQYDSVIAIVEPPVTSVDGIGAFLDAHPKLSKMPNGPAKTDLRNALNERLKTRLKEWDEFEADRAQWTRDPSQRVDGKPGGVKVDFDPEFNQLERKYIDEKPNQRGRVLEEPDIPVEGQERGRKVYRVQMEDPSLPPGPDGTRFRDITGDIDFLAILTPDGRVLGDGVEGAQLALELKQRAKVYQLMQELVGMQHGESFTIPPGKVREKYMKDGLNSGDGETLLAATPQKRLMTTYFDDGLSTLLGGPNGDIVQLYERSFFEGIFQEVLSPPRILNLVTVAELRAASAKFRSITQYFGVSIFARITGLLNSDVKDDLDRSGPALQPGEDGGVAQYEAPPRPSGRLGEAIFPGSAGGEWRPVTRAELVANGPVGLRPWTYIDGRVGVGDLAAPAVSKADMGVPTTSPWFRVGDVVVVDPGGLGEELATLATVSPMTFTSPLTNDHEWGAMVLLAYPDAVGSGGGGGVGAAIVSLSPERLLETRPGSETFDGKFELGRTVAAGSVTELQVTGRAGVPGDAAAVMLNVTAVRPVERGFLTVFPCGGAVPNASNVNYVAGQNVPNAVLAKVGVGGKVCIYTFAQTHLLTDVSGYVP